MPRVTIGTFLQEAQNGENSLQRTLKRTLGQLGNAENAARAVEASRKRLRIDAGGENASQAVKRPREEDIYVID